MNDISGDAEIEEDHNALLNFDGAYVIQKL
jgi:hypothetical protein